MLLYIIMIINVLIDDKRGHTQFRKKSSFIYPQHIDIYTHVQRLKHNLIHEGKKTQEGGKSN